MSMIKSRIYMIRQILLHLGWVNVSESRIKELALRFSTDDLNTILRRVEIKRCG